MTAILGVSCYFHDAAAALLVDGQLVAAAEEERFSRLKHDSRFPHHAIRFCLDSAHLEHGHLDYVAFYEKPLSKLSRVLTTSAATAPRSRDAFRHAMSLELRERLGIRRRLARATQLPRSRILFIEHHLAHAASAFYSSPFEEAAIITVDGVGEWKTATAGYATADWRGDRHNAIDLTHHMNFPHSLGLLYSAFTAYLGFDINDGEYKVMGMAAYGTPRYVEEIHKMVHVYSDGSFWLDMRFFTWHYSHRLPFTDHFVELLGAPPRDPSSEFSPSDPSRRSEDEVTTHRGSEAARDQRYADIAASVQFVLEEIIVEIARHAQRSSSSKNVCIAGGTALNGLANMRVLTSTPFENVFIPPSPGDGGGALGAALHVEHGLLGNRRRFTMEHAYWGSESTDDDVRKAITTHSLRYEEHDPDRLVQAVTDELVHDRVGGWFQGRFEWGPRALGNRSIVASPRHGEMKEVINTKVKYREAFRPFAPSVLEHRASEFVATGAVSQYPSRFMLMVLPLKASAAKTIPAASHLGTVRIQTVRPEWNPMFHRLIESFDAATGVPAVLNTSFNLRGEPIVATPEDAVSTFLRSGLDFLVLNHFVIRKRP